MIAVSLMLVFLDFGENGLETTGIAETDCEDDKGTEAHDGEDTGKEPEGLDEFVHDGGSVGDSLRKVKRRIRYCGAGVLRLRFLGFRY